MERRNFIKNITALAVASQIDIAEATDLKAIDEATDQTPGILLTLRSANKKIEFKVTELTLAINDREVNEMPAPFPPSHIRDLVFTAKLTEKQLTFINCTLWDCEKIQFMFEVDNLIYEGKGQLYENEFNKETLESNVTLRIKSGNVIQNET